MTNEIDAITNPVQLLLIIFSADYHQKARFEAKRKLLLMNLAGSIDQLDRETNIEAKLSGFLDFLNEYVWAPDLKIGELELVYILSRHRPTSTTLTWTRPAPSNYSGSVASWRNSSTHPDTTPWSTIEHLPYHPGQIMNSNRFKQILLDAQLQGLLF